jgi:hypothetical protein
MRFQPSLHVGADRDWEAGSLEDHRESLDACARLPVYLSERCPLLGDHEIANALVNELAARSWEAEHDPVRAESIGQRASTLRVVSKEKDHGRPLRFGKRFEHAAQFIAADRNDDKIIGVVGHELCDASDRNRLAGSRAHILDNQAGSSYVLQARTTRDHDHLVSGLLESRAIESSDHACAVN